MGSHIFGILRARKFCQVEILGMRRFAVKKNITVFNAVVFQVRAEQDVSPRPVLPLENVGAVNRIVVCPPEHERESELRLQAD